MGVGVQMLYDTPQLACTYLTAHKLASKRGYGCIAADILDYMLRDLRHPEGGFFSAEVTAYFKPGNRFTLSFGSDEQIRFDVTCEEIEGKSHRWSARVRERCGSANVAACVSSWRPAELAATVAVLDAKLWRRCREGILCRAQDADSLDRKTGQKKEGLFYLWTGAAGPDAHAGLSAVVARGFPRIVVAL